MAYHPDGDGGGFGGVAQTVKGLHSGGGYNVLPEGSGSTGNSRGERNNNRGNIKFGAFAKAHGATGADSGGFAIFPDQATGDAAHSALIGGDSYKGLTLDQFGNKYAEGSASWKKTVGGALGIGLNDIVNNKDPRLSGAIRNAEGTNGHGGGPTGVTGNQTGRTDPYAHRGGMVDVQGTKYPWGSGGSGYASMPFGDYPITPGTIGAWGQAHGALGVNNNKMFDPVLGRMRNGIELHSGSSDALITEGCMAIAGARWPQFKKQVLQMIATNGHAYLHMGADGASVTPDMPGHSTVTAGAKLRDHIRRGSSRTSFTNPTGLDGNASGSGSGGGVGTHHKLSVDFNNMPKGTRTAYSGDKGLFKEVKLNRGRAMGFASQDS
jgi:hypothetical protein